VEGEGGRGGGEGEQLWSCFNSGGVRDRDTSWREKLARSCGKSAVPHTIRWRGDNLAFQSDARRGGVGWGETY